MRPVKATLPQGIYLFSREKDENLLDIGLILFYLYFIF